MIIINIIMIVGSGARETTAIRFYLHIVQAFCRPITMVITKSRIFMICNVLKPESRNPATWISLGCKIAILN